MSVYYQCRLRNCVFDLSTQNTLVSVLEKADNESNSTSCKLPTNTTDESTVVIDGIEVKDKYILVTNNFKEGLKFNIDLTDLCNVKLDLCFGTKNNDDSMYSMLRILSLFYKHGDIIWYNEFDIRTIDIRKAKGKPTDMFSEVTYQNDVIVEMQLSKILEDCGYVLEYGEEYLDYKEVLLHDGLD